MKSELPCVSGRVLLKCGMRNCTADGSNSFFHSALRVNHEPTHSREVVLTSCPFFYMRVSYSRDILIKAYMLKRLTLVIILAGLVCSSFLRVCDADGGEA